MKLNQIVVGLSAAPISGPEAEQLARMGFLEWSMSLDQDADVCGAARDAMARMHSFVSCSQAVAEFRIMLTQAARPITRPYRKGGRRAQTRLH